MLLCCVSQNKGICGRLPAGCVWHAANIVFQWSWLLSWDSHIKTESIPFENWPSVCVQYYLKLQLYIQGAFVLACLSLLRISSEWVYHHLKVWMPYFSPHSLEMKHKHQVSHAQKYTSDLWVHPYLTSPVWRQATEMELVSWILASWGNSVWVAIMTKRYAVKPWYSAVMAEGERSLTKQHFHL